MEVTGSDGQSIPAEADWPTNYFNYFTEIEEHFRQARGSGLFLLSPLDWALIETWKNGGVPLAAALRGIDEAFTKWHARKQRTQAVNSVAYCQQAVMRHAQILAGAAPPKPDSPPPAPFTLDELRTYIEGNAQNMASLPEIAASLRVLLTDLETHYSDLEELERRLTALEEKVLATLRSQESEEQLLEARRALDRQLQPYRSKMSAPQLAMLERQFLDRRLLEQAGLRRLSLFYMGA